MASSLEFQVGSSLNIFPIFLQSFSCAKDICHLLAKFTSVNLAKTRQQQKDEDEQRQRLRRRKS